jgi:hypothetical protein
LHISREQYSAVREDIRVDAVSQNVVEDIRVEQMPQAMLVLERNGEFERKALKFLIWEMLVPSLPRTRSISAGLSEYWTGYLFASRAGRLVDPDSDECRALYS